MQRVSHFNFFVRGLLQICSYLVQQLPTPYKVLINPDVFLSAFTMEDEDGERVQARSWAGAPDGSAYDTTLDAGLEPVTDIPMDVTGDHEPQNTGSGVAQVGIPTGQPNSIVARRCFGLLWIGRQQKRYLFLPIAEDREPNWEFLRNRWSLGPHGARQIKGTKGKGKKSSGKLERRGKSSTADNFIDAEDSAESGPKPSRLRSLIHKTITDIRFR